MPPKENSKLLAAYFKRNGYKVCVYIRIDWLRNQDIRVHFTKGKGIYSIVSFFSLTSLWFFATAQQIGVRVSSKTNYAALVPIQIRIHKAAVYISNDCVFPGRICGNVGTRNRKNLRDV